MVGFGPRALGWVWMFCTAVELGGTRLFKLNEINAFFTGKIPGDWSSRRPRISILTW